MRKGVARHKLEAVIVASGKSGLQTVVGRAVKVREVVDLAEIRESAGKGQGTVRGRSRRSLIDIYDARKFYSMISNVGDVKRQFARERMLDAQSPVRHVGSAEIAIHGESVARVPRATCHERSKIGGVDGRGLIRIIQATRTGQREVDGGGENVSDSGATGGRGALGVENRCASRNDADAKEYRPALQVLLRQEGATGDYVINDAAANANDGGAVTRDIPSDTHARREVLAVTFVDGADVFAHLFQAD